MNLVTIWDDYSGEQPYLRVHDYQGKDLIRTIKHSCSGPSISRTEVKDFQSGIIINWVSYAGCRISSERTFDHLGRVTHGVSWRLQGGINSSFRVEYDSRGLATSTFFNDLDQAYLELKQQIDDPDERFSIINGSLLCKQERREMRLRYLMRSDVKRIADLAKTISQEELEKEFNAPFSEFDY